MIEHTWFTQPFGTVCVIDIETSPDPLAMAMFGGRRTASREASAALHRINDVSVLFATEAEDGSWRDFRVASHTAVDTCEEVLLRAIDDHLVQLRRKEGRLISYNGIAHDLPTIRRRAARHLMFDMPGLDDDNALRHLDMMLMVPRNRRGQWSKLNEVAAGLGIPIAHELPSRGIGQATVGIRKSQVDVVMTFLVFLYELALRRRCADPVIAGWRGLGAHIRGMGPHGEHLAQFRRHLLGAPSQVRKQPG